MAHGLQRYSPREGSPDWPLLWVQEEGGRGMVARGLSLASTKAAAFLPLPSSVGVTLLGPVEERA